MAAREGLLNDLEPSLVDFGFQFSFLQYLGISVLIFALQLCHLRPQSARAFILVALFSLGNFSRFGTFSLFVWYFMYVDVLCID